MPGPGRPGPAALRRLPPDRLRRSPGPVGQRVACPRRAAVRGSAHVLDPLTVRAAQHRPVAAVVAQLGAGREGAVPVVHPAAGPVGAVGEHHRPGQTVRRPVQRGGQPPELLLALRVDGDELARRTPVAVARVDLVQLLRSGGELEGARVVGQHLGDGGQDGAADRRGRAHMDLPALRGQFRRGRPDRAPEALGGDLPVAAASPASGAGQRRPRHLRPSAGRTRPVARRSVPPGRTQRCARPHPHSHPFVSAGVRRCPLLRHPRRTPTA